MRTPLLRLPLDGEVYVKPESLQRTGSFKFRGAYNALASTPFAAIERGVVADSSGNHAQGVAAAAALHGVPATIVMPENAAPVKVARTAAWGAEIVRCANSSDERQRVAAEIRDARGLEYIPPFDDVRIIAGQGTVGLEVVEDLPGVLTVVVCVGGGGHISGVATAVKALCPRARVIGVEPELAADAQESLREGRIVSWPAADVTRTICDGVRTQALGELTFATISALVDEIVTVPRRPCWTRCAGSRSRRSSSSSRPVRSRSRRCRPAPWRPTGRPCSSCRAGTWIPRCGGVSSEAIGEPGRRARAAGRHRAAAIGAPSPPVSARRSAGASSISRPRRPALTWIVSNPSAESSSTVGSRLR